MKTANSTTTVAAKTSSVTVSKHTVGNVIPTRDTGSTSAKTTAVDRRTTTEGHGTGAIEPAASGSSQTTYADVTQSMVIPASTTNSTRKTTKNKTTENNVTTGKTTISTVATEAAQTSVVYSYRKATSADSLIRSSLNFPNDAIVITGVKIPSVNGVYVVPDVIDGYRVIAVAAQAFCGSDAQIVALPAGIKDVWDEAFADCYRLTDVFLASEAVHIAKSAFAAEGERVGTLTLHCRFDCRDEEYYYYRNEPVREAYAAAYREWDGDTVEWGATE